jgi:LDH2 family malate/lactate/ureidoglycolate dehydrogenase
MSLGIKIYKIRDYIRKTETGEIDFDRSIKICRDLAAAAAFHTDHNILRARAKCSEDPVFSACPVKFVDHLTGVSRASLRAGGE